MIYKDKDHRSKLNRDFLHIVRVLFYIYIPRCTLYTNHITKLETYNQHLAIS